VSTGIPALRKLNYKNIQIIPLAEGQVQDPISALPVLDFISTTQNPSIGFDNSVLTPRGYIALSLYPKFQLSKCRNGEK
jgi:hypothetical protein